MKKNQLELAVLLARATLPLWEKYTSSGLAFYRDTTSLLSTTIDKELLAVSLKEIEAMGPLFPGNDYQKINDCYHKFIGPVVALQDGDWVPPYAIKKIFLAFYNILKGIVENNKANYNENFFVIAIGHSLDCIDLTKLYTSEQVNQMLLSYKRLL